MNDRFKFRVWDLQEKTDRMIYLTIDYLKERQGNLQDFLYSKRFIKMQSTGWRDKNGKLIFEGDVLIDKETKLKHLVIYFKTAIGCIRTDLYKEHGCCSFGFWLPTNEQWQGMEIIGNKFSNPELLKGEK